MYLESINKVTPTIASNLGIFLISFLCPGFVLIYVVSPDLFIAIDFLKLSVLAVSISCPTFIVPFIVTALFYRGLRLVDFDNIEYFGSPVDWYLRHGMTNALNMYLIVVLAAVFDLDVIALVVIAFLIIVVNLCIDVFVCIRFIKKPSINSSFWFFHEIMSHSSVRANPEE